MAINRFVVVADTDAEALAVARRAYASGMEVRDTLMAQLRTAGSNYCICRFAFGDLSPAESLRSLDLFVRDAMPAIAAMA